MGYGLFEFRLSIDPDLSVALIALVLRDTKKEGC